MTPDPPSSPTRPQQSVIASISNSLSPGNHLGLSVWLVLLELLWLFVVCAGCSPTREENVRNNGVDVALLKRVISKLETEFQNVSRNSSSISRGGGLVNTLWRLQVEELNERDIPESVEKSDNGAGIVQPWSAKRFRRRNGGKRQLSGLSLEAEPWTRDTTQKGACETWRPTLTVAVESRTLVVDICDSLGPQPRELTTCVRELTAGRDQCTSLFSPECQLPFTNLSVGAYIIMMKPYCPDCFEALYLRQLCDTTLFKSKQTYQIVDHVQSTRVTPVSYIATVVIIGVGVLVFIGGIAIKLICLPSTKSCKNISWCTNSSSPPELNQCEMGNSFLSPSIQTDEERPGLTVDASTAASSFTHSVEFVQRSSQAMGSQHNFKSREHQELTCFIPPDSHTSFNYDAVSQEGISSVPSLSPRIQCAGTQCSVGDTRPSSNRVQSSPNKDIIIPNPGIMFKVELPEVIHKIPYKLMEQTQLTPNLGLLGPTFKHNNPQARDLRGHNPQTLVHPRELCSSCVTINSSTSV